MQRYQQSTAHAIPKEGVKAWHFCADEYNANLCADLVLRGEKTATCSMLYWYESGGLTMPTVGELSVVTDWQGSPLAVIETTAVDTCAFSAVTEDWAAAEGEGDKTLRWWRDAHWAFFSRECRELGISASPDMLLVMERFRLLYSE